MQWRLRAHHEVWDQQHKPAQLRHRQIYKPNSALLAARASLSGVLWPFVISLFRFTRLASAA